MKIGDELYVIVDPNDRIVGGETYPDIQEARDELAWQNGFEGPVHRIASVRLVEIKEESPHA